VDCSGSVGTWFIIQEFGGSWGSLTYDAPPSAVTGTSSPITAPSVTPSTAGGVLIAVLGGNNNHGVISVDDGYTISENQGNRLVSSHLTFTSPAAHAPAFSVSAYASSGLQVQHFAFLEAGTGPSAAAIDTYRRLCGIA